MNFLTLSSRLATARRDLASNSDKKPKKSKKICEKKVVSEIGKSEILEFCWLYLSAKCINCRVTRRSDENLGPKRSLICSIGDVFGGSARFCVFSDLIGR